MFIRERQYRLLQVSLWLGLVICAVFLNACGSQSDLPYETVQEASLSAGDVVPAPSGEVVLTITGDIANFNEGESLVFDMETLESVGLVRYTVSDPWQQKDVTYTGVLLSDLLAVADLQQGATAVNVVALNDYAAEVPIAESEEWPILLATRADDEYMDVDNSGPTRIIFPYDNYIDLSAARNMSVWNVSSFEIK
jgi:hypothetical protein